MHGDYIIILLCLDLQYYITVRNTIIEGTQYTLTDKYKTFLVVIYNTIIVRIYSELFLFKNFVKRI